MQNNNAVLRPLGGLEEFFHLSKAARSHTVVVAAQLDGEVPKSRWATAIREVTKTNPALRTEIQKEGSRRPYFRLSNEPNEIEARILPDDTDLTSFIKDELETPFVDINRLWRLAVFIHEGKTDVIVSVDHTILDGLGVSMLIEDLLTAASGETPRTRPGFIHSHDEYVGISPNDDYMSRDEDVTEAQSAMNSRISHAAELSVEHATLEPSDVSAISARAKANGTTVHGALTAALLVAGATLSAQWKSEPVNYVSPVDNRSLVHVPDYFGLFITFALGQFDASAGKHFWDIARQVREEIIIQRTLEQASGMFEHLREVMKFEVASQECLALLPPWDLMVTNYGIVPIRTNYTSFTLKMLTPHVISRPYGQTVSAATVNGVLRLSNVSYAPIPSLLSLTKSVLLTHAAEN
ncbi:condensation domain-containing protein [Oryzifoliimicrobium ureilyticus]|uniref:condensation domain-containing protein n=1 Tax=Oryzifoliimicrobium ureilyticus TaxID=3113724 RepID=UPI0030762EBF